MRVFLTGGTGLVGSHLACALRAQGDEVTALCRHGADTEYLSSLGCRLVVGDVTDPVDSLARFMERSTHAVHGAALVYAGAGWDQIRTVNVGGTRKVLEAAARAGVAHAVHVSSVAVYGQARGPVDESAPLDAPLPDGEFYARSKREAEAAAREVEARDGLPVTILRPSAVYGERDRLMVPALARILRSPAVPVFGPGDNTLPVVYAGNVADAIIRALEAERGGAVYDVGFDGPLTQRQLFRGLAEGLGRNPYYVHLPAGLVRTVVRGLSRLGIGTPGASHLPLERVARLALGENPYPSTRIREELGWRPREDHRESLIRSGRWYAAHTPSTE